MPVKQESLYSKGHFKNEKRAKLQQAKVQKIEKKLTVVNETTHEETNNKSQGGSEHSLTSRKSAEMPPMFVKKQLK